jgi:hypothetical protein
VRRLLAQGGGWWTAEEVAAQPGEIEDLRAGLKELRRIGVLWWDSDIGGYALVEALRVPLALTLLACDAPQQQDQLLLLDRLLPFAQLASRGDAQAAPAWAMMDLLARDVRALKQARASGPEQLALLAKEKWLIRSAEDMKSALQHLRGFSSEHPALSDLVDEAVELLSEAGELIAGLSIRMSRSAKDHLRLVGSRRSASQLRESLALLDADKMAASVASVTGLTPLVLKVPSSSSLAAAWPDLDKDLVGRREYSAGHFQALPESEGAAPDSLSLARARLSSASVFDSTQKWSEAVRIHQGLVRIQGEAARSGKPEWQAVAEKQQIRGEVEWAWKITIS